jgi:hypothetical protein
MSMTADNPACLPDGGEVRQQPWEAISMSRAAWYRHGKPTAKPAPRMTQAQIAKKFGTSLRSMQRSKRALTLAGEDIEKRTDLGPAELEREAMYIWIRRQMDAATSEDDKTYFSALELALRSKHNEQRNKTERMKRIWRNANEDERQDFIDWLQSGCRDGDCDEGEA